MRTSALCLAFAMTGWLVGTSSSAIAAQTLVLTNANIVDGTGGPVQQGMTIVIVGDTIVSISEGPYQAQAADADDSAQVHDLDGAWVLPGFWNMHTHLGIVFPDNHALDGELMPSKVIRAGLNAMDGLRHGFTSVRSVGEEGNIDVAWQRAFDQVFLGPRVFASGEPVSPTAGHRGLVAYGADGVAAVRKAVRSRIQQGASTINSMPIGEMGFLEMEQFVLSGVSEMDTIIAATRNPAVLLGPGRSRHGRGRQAGRSGRGRGQSPRQHLEHPQDGDGLEGRRGRRPGPAVRYGELLGLLRPYGAA